jgi:hypothetical protein
MRKTQLVRTSRGNENATRVSTTQNPIIRMLEASNGTFTWCRAVREDSLQYYVWATLIFWKRIVMAKPALT